MSEAKLSCCVVRDLLPSYIEELTEDETARLVKDHLDCCPECRRIETEMRSRIGIAPAPAPRLCFLRRYKRRQVISAALAAIIAIVLMCLLYSSEFKYQNTEAGRLLAVEDYVAEDKPDSYPFKTAVETGTPLTVNAWAQDGGSLYLFYTADNAEHVRGYVRLERGINGRYRPLKSSCSPSKLTAGVYLSRDLDSGVYLLAAYGCRGIYSAQLSFSAYYDGHSETVVKTVEIPSSDFLRLMSPADLIEYLGVDSKGLDSISLSCVRLFDEDGSDVSAQYADESVTQSWGSGKGSAETGMVYFLIAIVAALGIILVRFFLKKD